LANLHLIESQINDCLQPGAEASKTQFSKLSADDGATAYGLAMGGGTDHSYSEDCLALNVWTKPQTGEPSKAVFVWIHGGAFGAGTSNAPYMNGARLASEHDLVVVSIK
jgi:carboxylesterase type B